MVNVASFASPASALSFDQGGPGLGFMCRTAGKSQPVDGFVGFLFADAEFGDELLGATTAF